MPKAKKVGAGRFVKKTVSARRNPEAIATKAAPSKPWPFQAEVLGAIVPGAGAYAGTRIVSKVVQNLLARRWERVARHSQPVTSVATLLGLYYLCRRWKKAQPYAIPLIVGSGIATLHAIIQTWFPRLAGIMGISQAPQLPASSGGEYTASQVTDENDDMPEDVSSGTVNVPVNETPGAEDYVDGEPVENFQTGSFATN